MAPIEEWTPADRTPDPAQPADDVIGSGREGRQRHVMVIEDTPHVLALLVEILEDAGYRVTPEPFRTSVGELFDRLKADPPDLILLDLMLGEAATGWDLLCQLKRDRNTLEVPVVLCSAAANLVQMEQPLLTELAVSVVLKPFDIDHLLLEIGSACDAQIPAERS